MGPKKIHNTNRGSSINTGRLYPNTVTNKKSLTWLGNLSALNLNTVHKNRKCDISVIMEREIEAHDYIEQLKNNHIEDDIVISVEIKDLFEFFRACAEELPNYFDPQISKMFTDTLKDLTINGIHEAISESVDVLAALLKLRVLALLKENVYKYENPIRHRENLMEEYRLLVDVPDATAGGKGKKGGKKKGKEKGKKGKSTSKSGKSKKGKGSAVKEEYPCTMLQNNIRKAIRQPRWNMVTIEQKTLQMVITGCYNCQIFQALSKVNMPVKTLLEVCTCQLPFLTQTVSPSIGVSKIGHLSEEEDLDITISSADNKFESSFTNKVDLLQEFWNEFISVCNRDEMPSYLVNLYCLKYIPSELNIDKTIVVYYNEQCLNTYNNIKTLLESTSIVDRMYNNYVNHIEVYCSTFDLRKCRTKYCRVYNDLLDNLPPDSCTVEIVVDALLHQVEDSLLEQSPVDSAVSTNKWIEDKPQKSSDVRTFVIDIFKRYRINMTVANYERVERKLESCLFNLKYDLTLIRASESNKLAKFLYPYLHLKASLENKCIKTLKYLPFYRLLRNISRPEYIKTCNELNFLSSKFSLDRDELYAFLGVVIFNLINWVTYKKTLKDTKYFDDPKVIEILYILKGKQRFYKRVCDSINNDIISCKNLNRNINFKLYEKLNGLDMLQQLQYSLHWFNSIKYYYCALLDSLLLEFFNELDSFGISNYNWSVTIRSKPSLINFCRNVLNYECDWLLAEEMQYRSTIPADEVRTEEVVLPTVKMQNAILNSIPFILNNTLKDVLRNEISTAPPEPGSKDVKKSKSSKSKLEKLSSKAKIDKKLASTDKLANNKMKRKSSVGLQPKSNIAINEPVVKKVFFTDNNLQLKNFTGTTTSFLSTDGVKISYDTNSFLKYKTLNVDIEQNHFIMHILPLNEDFLFHFHLENGIIINMFKPVKSKIVDYVHCDKLYTVTKHYTAKLNNFQPSIKTRSTYLISENVLERIREKHKKKVKVTTNADHVSNSFKAVGSNLNEDVSQAQGDADLVTISNKCGGIQMVKDAQESNIPIFKICSSKLHQFNYIKRVKSHAQIPVGDAVTRIANTQSVKPKRKYVFRELVGSIQNEDITGCDKYSFSVTLPTTLTIQSETNIQGRRQIRQYYIQKGPQCKDISFEVSRTYTSNGDLVIKLVDGTIQILSINGDIIDFNTPLFDKKVNSCTNIAKENRIDSKYRRAMRRLIKRSHVHGVNNQCTNSSRKQLKYKNYQYLSSKNILIAKRYKYWYPNYTLINITGNRLHFQEGKVLHEKVFFPNLEEDFVHRTFKITREDGTTVEMNKKGDLTTTFIDGTILMGRYEIDPNLVVFVLDNLKYEEEEEVSVTSPWVLIHMYREFSHPNYASVILGGPDDTCEIKIPNGVNLTLKDENIDLIINSKLSAFIDTSTIKISSSLCPNCKAQTSTVINTERLYNEDENISGKDTFVEFTDSFMKRLKINYDGDFIGNDDYISDGLNSLNCMYHRTFNNRKFFLVNKDYSGIRLWSRESYLDRLYVSIKDNEILPDVFASEDNNIFFKRQSCTPLHQQFLMIPNDNRTVWFETYRTLLKLKFSKYTDRFLDESEGVTTDYPHLSPGKHAGDSQLSKSSEMLFDRGSAASYFSSVKMVDSTEVRKDMYEIIRRKCAKRELDMKRMREEAREPINYFKYMAKCKKRDEEECFIREMFAPDRSVERDEAGQLGLVSANYYIHLDSKESNERMATNTVNEVLGGINYDKTSSKTKSSESSAELYSLYNNTEAHYKSELLEPAILSAFSDYSAFKKPDTCLSSPEDSITSLGLVKHIEELDLRQESSLLQLINEISSEFEIQSIPGNSV